MLRPRATIVPLVLSLVGLGSPAARAAPGDGVRLEPVASFSSPTEVKAPPADARRLFVVEQAGRVAVVRDGAKLEQPFLDINDLVLSGGERGLLSVAFAPDYATSGRVFVYYTRRDDPGTTADETGDVVLDEFRRSAGDPERADRSTRRTLLTHDHSRFPNHNGGQLQFGPDGLLYVSIGDGGGGGDPLGSGQSLGTLLGKVLRIDPNPTQSAPYAVPAGNPFTGQAGARPEIWAYGLRNPFRFSFDRETGDLILADVGQSAVEEVDFLPAVQGGGRGANLGWNCFEGRRRYANPPCDPPGHVPPVLERLHSDGDCSITGGYVVRDRSLPSLFGRYLHGDFCTGDIRAAALATPTVTDDPSTGLRVTQLSSFGEDACGRLYVASLGGQVSRLAGPTSAPCPPPGGDPNPPGDGQTPDPPPATPADVTPPVVMIRARRIQRLAGGRYLRVSAGCDELCTLTVVGRLRARDPDRSFRTRVLVREVLGGSRRALQLSFARRSLRRVRHLLGRGRRLSGRFSVVARDTASNRGLAGLSFTLRH